jgi:hypothetical protein
LTLFLDNDVLPKYGEKPERWQSSGIRVKRGLSVFFGTIARAFLM